MNPTTNSFTLQAATQLAAGGNYRASSALLDTLPEKETDIEVSLLRAKMCAQQGNYPDAIKHWQTVLSKQPGNKEAQEGIAKANRLNSRPGGKLFWRARIFYALLLLLFIGLVGLFSFMMGRGSMSRGGPDLSATTELMAIQSQQSQQIREIDENLKSLIAKSKTPPAIKIDIPGIQQSVEGNTIVLIFEKGLFNGGSDRLRSDALPLLSSLVRQLKAHAGEIFIRVIGHTDNTPLPQWSPYNDNESLGLARAVAVIEHLRASAQLPSRLFIAATAGESLPPYDNDSQENRVRNRTVVIRIFRSNHDQN